MATTKLPTITLTKGLPGSGKSTWAKEQVHLGKGVRVNKDDLRNMLHDGKYSTANEDQVIACQLSIINNLLDRNRNVIVDDTNLNPKNEIRLREAFDLRCKFEIKDFTDVPVQTCIERDAKREGKANVGPEVILKMYEQYMRPMTAKKTLTLEEASQQLNLPNAIIVDMDGTLAHGRHHRSMYDWKKVGNDDPDYPTINLVQRLDSDHHIIIMSGRDEACRPETTEWLKRYDVPFDRLYMRKAGDQRKDTIVKRELYDSFIKDQFNIKFALEDRDGIVDLWRSIGIKCYQCEPGFF